MKVRVPLAALAIDDAKPQPGDPVDLTATGSLSSIDGESAEVEIDSLNGQPVPQDAGAGEPDAGEPDGDELRGMAEEADRLPYGNP